MDTTKHDINTLFAQLGLPNTESQIDTFIASHELEDTTLLQNAIFWDEAQRHFLAESLAEDGDWSEVIDELDVRLRQGM
jgi:outer membrane receptor for monomeric catechols